MKKSIRQRGDTLIEVLFAMVIVGLSLASSYSIANKSLATGRAAQERTEALKLAEAQLEFLRGVDRLQIVDYKVTTPLYCIVDGSKVDASTPSTSKCLGKNRTPSSFYNLSVRYTPADALNRDFFESIVKWIPINSSNSLDTVKLRYRP